MKHFKILIILCGLSVPLFGLNAYSGTVASESVRPNVIMINIDNHDTSVLGFAGNEFLETPNIDKLKKDGVFLSNYRCSARCGPSRASLMTGRYATRSGHIQTHDGRNIMGTNAPTIAELFKKAGYRTGMYGKWHIGKNYPFRPQDRGFDEVVQFRQGELDKRGESHQLRHNGKWEAYEGYRIDIWFRELCKLVKSSGDTPFMAYLATWATHGGNFGRADLSKKYRAKMDAYGAQADTYFKNEEEKYNFAELAAEMESIDTGIGLLLDTLKQEGVLENTIIVYTSDGGGFTSPALFMRKDRLHYVGKAPAIIHWPGGKLKQGQNIDTLVANFDLSPTLMDICGINPPADLVLDGQSVYGLMCPGKTPWKERVYIADHQSRNGPRTGYLMPMDQTTVYMPGGKAVSFHKGKAKRSDTPELEAVARRHWEEWWESVAADFEPYQYVVVGTEHENPMYIAHPYYGINEVQSKVKDYHFAIEVAAAGTFEFSAEDDPKNGPGKDVKSGSGYVQVGDRKYEGQFPMKLKLEPGRKMVRVFINGKPCKKFKIEKIRQEVRVPAFGGGAS